MLPRALRIWFTYSLLLQSTVCLSTSPQSTNRTAPTPSLFPGDDGFKLQGCFSQPGSGTAGQTLGKEFFMPASATAADHMTVPLCLTSCATAKTRNGVTFSFVAVGDGR